MLSIPVIAIIIVVIYILSSIKILAEYERGVIFRLGRVLPKPKGPGIVLVFAPIDRIVRISLRTETLEVPPQDVITRDNVTVKVNAVIYFRVLEPTKAVIEVANGTIDARIGSAREKTALEASEGRGRARRRQ